VSAKLKISLTKNKNNNYTPRFMKIYLIIKNIGIKPGKRSALETYLNPGKLVQPGILPVRH